MTKTHPFDGDVGQRVRCIQQHVRKFTSEAILLLHILGSLCLYILGGKPGVSGLSYLSEVSLASRTRIEEATYR